MEIIGKKLLKLSIFAKKWPNFGLKWPKFCHIRIFPAYTLKFYQIRPKEKIPYQKLRIFIEAFGSYRTKTLKTVNFGQKMAKISPKSMVSSKKTTRTTSIPKIRKIHSGVWKLKDKNNQNCKFLPKNGQIFVLNGQSFAKSEFSRHIEYDFLKVDHKNNFHTINQEDS